LGGRIKVKKENRKEIDLGVIDENSRGWKYHPNRRLEGMLRACELLKWENINKENKNKKEG
jgi:hypothetical protein